MVSNIPGLLNLLAQQIKNDILREYHFIEFNLDDFFLILILNIIFKSVSTY